MKVDFYHVADPGIVIINGYEDFSDQAYLLIDRVTFSWVSLGGENNLPDALGKYME